jgi:hypothetical protein
LGLLQQGGQILFCTVEGESNLIVVGLNAVMTVKQELFVEKWVVPGSTVL